MRSQDRCCASGRRNAACARTSSSRAASTCRRSWAAVRRSSMADLAVITAAPCARATRCASRRHATRTAALRSPRNLRHPSRTNGRSACCRGRSRQQSISSPRIFRHSRAPNTRSISTAPARACASMAPCPSGRARTAARRASIRRTSMTMPMLSARSTSRATSPSCSARTARALAASSAP